jgi:hypothetical protein
MATKIYLCVNKDDIITDIMVTDYEMIHPERIEWSVADYTLKGKLYNRVTGLTEDAPPPAPQSIFTKLEFRQKFTLAELTAIYNAESTDVIVKIFLDDLKVSEFVDTNDAATQNGIGYLYNAAYITYERMIEILG